MNLFRVSSVVEQRLDKPLVASSNLALGTNSYLVAGSIPALGTKFSEVSHSGRLRGTVNPFPKRTRWFKSIYLHQVTERETYFWHRSTR